MREIFEKFEKELFEATKDSILFSMFGEKEDGHMLLNDFQFTTKGIIGCISVGFAENVNIRFKKADLQIQDQELHKIVSDFQSDFTFGEETEIDFRDKVLESKIVKILQNNALI